MAAPVFQSVQTSGSYSNTPSTRTVTKPTSLAVGDLMIACGVVDTNNDPNFPSGFTLIGTVGKSTGIQDTQALAFKIADSSDVAATDFTFTNTGFASISRITGAAGALGSLVYNGGVQTNSASVSLSGITPADHSDSTLLMMFFTVVNGSSPNIATYAIATSNPTWTEGYDASQTAMAYATRSQLTSTGNFSANGGGSASADWSGQIISIPVPFVFSVSDSVTTTDSSKLNQTIKKSESLSLVDSILATVFKWASALKNSTTWSESSKSSTTWSESSKNSTTWTNQSKS